MSMTRPSLATPSGTPSAVEAVAEHFFTRYPGFGRRAGWHRADGAMPSHLTRPVDELGDLLQGLSRVGDADVVDAEERADLAVASHLVRADLFLATELDQGTLTPTEVLAEVAVADYGRPYAPYQERIVSLRRHLELLPQFLVEATDCLPERLPAGERLQGSEMARGEATRLSAQVATLADAGEADVLQELCSTASAAVIDYGAAVSRTALCAGVYGPDRLAEYLRVHEGLQIPVQDLLEAARAEVRAAAQGMARVSAELGADDVEEAECMLHEHAQGDAREALIRILDRTRDFWEKTGLVDVGTDLDLEVEYVGVTGAAATVEFKIAAPLEWPRPPHLIQLPAQVHDTSGDSLRRRHLNDPMLEVLAVHEAFPGHLLHAEAAYAGGSLIRTCFPWIAGLAEGWAHYAEELAVQEGLCAGRPLVEFAQLRSSLDCATRAVAFLSVHSGVVGFGAAVSEAAAASRWSPERAMREVLAVTSQPLGAMYTLGKIYLRQWQTEIPDRGPAGVREFHDLLLGCGTAPLAVARKYVMERQEQIERRAQSRASN